MNSDCDWLRLPAAATNEAACLTAAERQACLTKPHKSLGRLEEMAIQLAALQNRDDPTVDKVCITVFVADHGVAVEGVSAFPQAVTAEMLKNFSRGGAAISVLAKELGANMQLINLGTAGDPVLLKSVSNVQLGPGTENFCQGAAMNAEQLSRALESGRRSAQQAKSGGAELFIGGEMGIANTTSATALACALLGEMPERLTGPGTGLDAKGVSHKTEIIRTALRRHNNQIGTPMEAMRRLGGFEIAALAGSYLTCAQIGLPVLIDGFISSVAALAAVRQSPGAGKWFLFSHTSVEPGHRLVLESMGAQPFLNLGMRLGEASGAAVAVPLLRLACALHNQMATFSEAGVSDAVEGNV